MKGLLHELGLHYYDPHLFFNFRVIRLKSRKKRTRKVIYVYSREPTNFKDYNGDPSNSGRFEFSLSQRAEDKFNIIGVVLCPEK